MEFQSQLELKQRVMPALKIRVKELRKQNYNYTEESLFNYFVSIWRQECNLTLADVVDDILNRKIDDKNQVIL